MKEEFKNHYPNSPANMATFALPFLNLTYFPELLKEPFAYIIPSLLHKFFGVYFLRQGQLLVIVTKI